MKKYIEIIALGVGAIFTITMLLLGFYLSAHAAQTAVFVSNGGTGTTTLPGYGKVLIGGKNGEYEFVASSTFASGGGSGTVTNIATTYPVTGGPITTTGTIGLAFGTTSSNTWGGTQTFTNNPVFTSIGAGVVNSTSGGTLYSTATSSVTNGTGIGLTGTPGALLGGTSLTITNTGVTGAAAGTGISVSGATGNVTITNSSPLSGLTASFPFNFSNPTLTWIGLATTSQPASSNLLVSNGAAGVYGVATTTASCSGSASCTSFTVIGSTPITISASGGGGSGTVGTSSSEVANEFPYWTTNSATPALLHGTSNLFNSSGNIGVGTSSPFAALSVGIGGDYGSHAASTAFAIGSSTAGNATSTLLSVSSTGNTNILGSLFLNPAGSTTAAPRALGFNPALGPTNAVQFQYGDTSDVQQLGYGDRFQTSMYWGIELRGNQETSAPAFDGGGATDPSVSIYGTSGDAHDILDLNNNGGTALDVVDKSGNLGIGTTSPAQPLSVNGKIYSGTGGFQFPDGTVQTTAASGGTNYWTLNGNNIYNNNNGGNGFVGIGTTTPNWLLQVATSSVGTTFNHGQIAITDTNAGTNLKHWLLSNEGGNFYLSTSSDSYATSTGSSMIAIVNNGSSSVGPYVGIGTSTPTDPLTIFANSALTGINLESNNGAASTRYIQFGKLGGTNWALAPSSVTNTTNLGILTNNGSGSNPSTEVMTIVGGASAGNVGIGSTTPTQLLSVGNAGTGTLYAANYDFYGTVTTGVISTGAGTDVVLGSGTTGTGGSVVYSASPAISGTATIPAIKAGITAAANLSLNGTSNASPTTANVNIAASSANGLTTTFTSTGVGIGTTTPAWILQAATSSITTIFHNGQFGITDTNAGTNLKHWLFSSEGGNLYIGTSSDAYATSTVAALSITNAGGVSIGYLPASAGAGAVCATAAGVLSYDNGANCIVSSKRFKTDIQSISATSSLAEVLKLNPVSFKYKSGYGDNGKATWVGFIAEQVDTVDKRLVQYDAQGKPYSVYYQNMTALLAGSIQSIEGQIQQILTRLDGTEKRLDVQQQEIDQLQSEINNLKK